MGIKMMVAVLALAATLGLCCGAPSTLGNGEASSTTISPYEAPIFREADLDGDNTAIESGPLQLDSEMTPAEQIEKLYSGAMAGEGQDASPAAYIKMGHWDVLWANKDPKYMGSDEEAELHPDPLDGHFEVQRMLHALATQKNKLNQRFKDATEPARGVRDFQAIRLGASLLAHETLAFNINSYVPDEFNDGEIVHMFELNEALRTGEKSLNVTELAELNSFLLSLYLRALAGLKGPVVIEPDSEEGGEECPICKDTLSEEPSYHLMGCVHKYHIDCVENWIRDKFIMKCPLCRQRFRQSFDSLQIQRST